MESNRERTIRRYRIGSIILFGFLAVFIFMEITLPDPAKCAGAKTFACGLAGLWEGFTDVFYPGVLIFTAGVAVWILKTTAFTRDLPD
mgnify:CR=1 FL=1